MPEPLTVWVLTEDKAGHDSQTRGIVNALRTRFEVVALPIQCRLRTGVFKAPARWLSRLLPKSQLVRVLNLLYRPLKLPATKPSIILASGGNTICALGCLASIFDTPSVFSGTLKNYPAKFIDLDITLLPTGGANNLNLPLPPVAVPDMATQRKAEEASAGLIGAVLIGGDGAGCVYSPHDWQRLAATLQAITVKVHQASRHNDPVADSLQWLLTTSRRTGTASETQLRNFCRASTLPIKRAVWWQQKPERVMADYLQESDFLVCTIDSLSMIAEAIYTGKRVLTFAPEKLRLSENDSRALKSYQQHGYITDLEEFAVNLDQTALTKRRPSPLADVQALIVGAISKLLER